MYPRRRHSHSPVPPFDGRKKTKEAEYVKISALKKAENSDEVVVRLVEKHGAEQIEARMTFAADIASALEINGSEEDIGPAQISEGALNVVLGRFQPRTFAVRLWG